MVALLLVAAVLLPGSGALPLPPLPGAGAVVGTVDVAGLPFSVAHDPMQDRVHVTTTRDDRWVMLSDDGLAVVGERMLGRSMGGVAVDSFLGHVYITHPEEALMSVWDAATLDLLAEVAVGPGAGEPFIDPWSPDVYVPNAGDGTVSRVDAVTLEEAARIEVGVTPSKGAVDPMSRRAFIPLGCEGLAVVSLDLHLATLPLDGCPLSAAVDPLAGVVVVPSAFGGTVSFVQAASGLVLREVEGGYWQLAVVVDPVTHRAYVTGSDHPNLFAVRGHVFVYATTTGMQLDEWETGAFLAWGAALDEGQRLFLPDMFADRVTTLTTGVAT